MPFAGVLVSIGRYGLAAVFLAGGIFNLTYGRRHPGEFYGSFADSAWLGPYTRLIEVVIVPNGAVFAVLLGAFELAVAGLILAGGTAMTVGLIAGIVFALLVVPASNLPGALANFGLAAVSVALLWSHLQG